MPDFLPILAVDPEREALRADLADRIEQGVRTRSGVTYPEAGEEHLVTRDLQEIMTGLSRVVPELDVTVLYWGTSDWVDVAAWLIRGGEVDQQPLQLSLAPDECRAVPANAAPEVVIDLDVEVDQVANAIAAAADDGFEPPSRTSRSLRLPFVYRDDRSLLEMAACIAEHMVEREIQLVVSVAGGYRLLRLFQRSAAHLDPLWPWMSDPAARALARRTLGPPGEPTSRRCSETNESRPFSDWEALVAHVRDGWDISEDASSISKLWDWSGTDRTQHINVAAVEIDGEPWVKWYSGIARTDQVSAERLIEAVEALDLGRIETGSGAYWLAHLLPLATVTPRRLDAFSAYFAQLSDDLEEQLTGGGDEW
jgi:hypothetical protein